MGEYLVYLVDGDPAVRDSLTTLMELNGCAVKSYATGTAFLHELPKLGDIQCVVCEAELPDTTGIAVYQALMQHDRQTRFALLLSQRNPRALKAALAAGIVQVFSKPLVHRHLLSFIIDQPANKASDSS